MKIGKFTPHSPEVKAAYEKAMKDYEELKKTAPHLIDKPHFISPEEEAEALAKGESWAIQAKSPRYLEVFMKKE